MQPSSAGQSGPTVNPLGGDHGWDAFPFVAQEAMPRPRLLFTVQGRWSRRVTAVVAGAGFGKTTLLAQAARENRLARTGVDVSLRLEPRDSSPLRLASRILAQLGCGPTRCTEPDDLVELLVDALSGRAPTAICLVLDDVHEVASGSAGLVLLHRLVRALPGNAHVLLGSRTLPEVGVARLVLNGEALVLREEDLRFTAAEVVEFAGLRGVEPEQLAAANGWPALAELLARCDWSHGRRVHLGASDQSARSGTARATCRARGTWRCGRRARDDDRRTSRPPRRPARRPFPSSRGRKRDGGSCTT